MREDTVGVFINFYSGIEIYANIAVKVSGKNEESNPLKRVCLLYSYFCCTESSKKKCLVNTSRMNEVTNAWISQLHNSVSRYSEPCQL